MYLASLTCMKFIQFTISKGLNSSGLLNLCILYGDLFGMFVGTSIKSTFSFHSTQYAETPMIYIFSFNAIWDVKSNLLTEEESNKILTFYFFL